MSNFRQLFELVVLTSMEVDLKERIYVQLSIKDAIIIALLAFSIMLAAIPLYPLLGPIGGIRIDILTLLLFLLTLLLLHEFIHVLSMISFGCRGIKPYIVSKIGIPLAIMILYDKMSISQYIMSALSPQIISIILFIITIYNKQYLDIWFYSGPLSTLSFMLLVSHLAMSAGDIYGVLLTLVKVRGLRGMIKCSIDSTGLKGVTIYLERKHTTNARGDQEE